MNFLLSVISTKGKVFFGEVAEVILPAETGQITVLANHMPLVAPLTLGEVVIKKADGDLHYSIGKGIFTIAANKADLLIEDEMSSDGISEEKAAEAIKKAEELVKKGVTKEEKVAAVYTLRKSLVDLKIVRRKHKVSMA